MLYFAVLVSPTPQHRDTRTPRTRTSDSDTFFATEKNTVFDDTGVNATATIVGSGMRGMTSAGMRGYGNAGVHLKSKLSLCIPHTTGGFTGQVKRRVWVS
jgi:hypothetical protein